MAEGEWGNMMGRKKLIAAMLVACLVMGITACGNTQISNQSSEVGVSTTSVLIAYFSRADNIVFDSDIDAVASASINNRVLRQVSGRLHQVG
jgi:uncharacterized lipoprotein YehR (DUF1307 family)